MRITPSFAVACLAVGLSSSAASAAVAFSVNGPANAGRSDFTSSAVGTRFSLDRPSGQPNAVLTPENEIRVTHLGFYAGQNTAALPGDGVVNFEHTVELRGPVNFGDRGGAFNNVLASVVVPAGAAVSADGFAYVALATPVIIPNADPNYYMLSASYVAGQAADPFWDPYSGPGGSAVLGSSVAGLFSDFKGRYGSGNGAEAFDFDGYLGANMMFDIVPIPEPTALALLGLLAPLAMRRRRD